MVDLRTTISLKQDNGVCGGPTTVVGRGRGAPLPWQITAAFWIKEQSKDHDACTRNKIYRYTESFWKTRKTRHSFALFLQERWIRVEWDFMISLFRLHKKTWRRHQPRWDEIAERRPLDLVAAPTFPTLKKNSKTSENNFEKKNKILTTSKLKTILLKLSRTENVNLYLLIYVPLTLSESQVRTNLLCCLSAS